MMTDIAAARGEFKNGTVLDIVFLRSSQSFAVGIPKAMQHKLLQQDPRTGCFEVEPKQWIVKK